MIKELKENLIKSYVKGDVKPIQARMAILLMTHNLTAFTPREAAEFLGTNAEELISNYRANIANGTMAIIGEPCASLFRCAVATTALGQKRFSGLIGTNEINRGALRTAYHIFDKELNRIKLPVLVALATLDSSRTFLESGKMLGFKSGGKIRQMGNLQIGHLIDEEINGNVVQLKTTAAGKEILMKACMLSKERLI